MSPVISNFLLQVIPPLLSRFRTGRAIEVRPSSLLDFEHLSDLELTQIRLQISASDGFKTSSINVTLIISDVNEAPECSQTLFYISVNEGNVSSLRQKQNNNKQKKNCNNKKTKTTTTKNTITKRKNSAITKTKKAKRRLKIKNCTTFILCRIELGNAVVATIAVNECNHDNDRGDNHQQYRSKGHH